MKKILSVILTVCLILSVFTIFASAGYPERQATIKAANDCGYGIWDFDNNQIIVHVTTQTAWDNICRGADNWFIGFCVSSSSNDDGTGIRNDPDVTGYAQYSGWVVNGSIDATTKTFAYTMSQNFKEVIEGQNLDTGHNFKTLVEKYGGVYAVRIDTKDENGQYVGYCLPVYDEAPDGLRFTSAEMQSNGQIIMRFNSETSNQYDSNNTNADLDSTIYDGVWRETYMVIVDNTTDWNVVSDTNGTLAKWSQSWLSDCWNGAQGYITIAVEYQGILGCNSYADVCALVDKDGIFEGCVVAYEIVERNDSSSNTSAVFGDGYINSFYTYGTWNDINYCLKADKTDASQGDAAFAVMYDPATNGDNLNAPVISWSESVSYAAKISASSYSALYYWTQIKDTDAHEISFMVKGTAGETISYGYEGSYGCAGTYTIQTTDCWEEVSFSFTSNSSPAAGAHTTNGFPFRIYINPSDSNVHTFYIDNVTFNGKCQTFADSGSVTSGNIYGSWTSGTAPTIDTTQNADSSIDHLYIDALVEDDGTYGILFAEDTYATDAQMKLPSDGGSPLFSRICTPRTAILESGVYGTAEITATNLGGETGDKVLAFYWTNMTAYSTFAARVYKILDDGTVVYGPITTVTTMTTNSSNLPLAN